MTREVQASEAKTHLPQLLDEVEPIARIIPEAHLQQQEIDEAIADIKELGKQTGKATVEEIFSLMREGRKY